MATGGLDMLELVTCPVCKDIFSDPKSLKCRHTICGECLDGLLASRRGAIGRNPLIKCPCCREFCSDRDVRDDFRVREMVAVFGAQVSLPENHLCEFCEKNKLRWRCTQCEAMICDDCKMVHEKVTMKGKSAKHDIQSVQELAEKMRNRLKESKDKMDSVLSTAAHDLKELRSYREHLQQSRGKILAEIDRQEKAKVDEIVSQFNDLRRKVYSSVAEELTKSSYKMNQVQAVVTNAHHKFSILGDQDDSGPQSITDIVVNYGMGEGEVSLFSLNGQWHAPAPNLHITYNPPKHTNSVDQQGLMLEDTNEAGSVEIIQNYEPIRSDFRLVEFDEILPTTFVKELEIEMPSYCHGFELVNGKLWCVEFDKNRILVLREDSGSVVKTISAPILEHPTCVINTSSVTGRLLIGCSYDAGLHEVDQAGNYKQMLCKGSICSGCVYNDELFVLQHQTNATDTSHVLTFRHSGTEWTLKQSMELDYCRTSHNDTIGVTSEGMRVTSWCNHNVLLYNFDGRFVRYEAELPNNDPGVHPRICQTDSQGHVMVSDSCHGKIYVLREGKQWETLKLPELASPRDAVVCSGDKHMWTLELNGTKLLKYKTV